MRADSNYSPTFLSLCRRPVHLLAFGLGSGLAPVAPGTVGTLACLPFYWLLSELPLDSYVLAVSALFVAGIAICNTTTQDLKVPDHPGIVWDEWVGYLVAMTAVPPSIPWVLAGFLLFRLFDVLKPGPIGWLDKNIHGGLGIMLDDLAAGLAAAAVLAIAQVLLGV